MTLEPGETPYGHFGLLVTDTAWNRSNRRYVDLIIRRLLKSVIRYGTPQPLHAGKLIDIPPGCRTGEGVQESRALHA